MQEVNLEFIQQKLERAEKDRDTWKTLYEDLCRILKLSGGMRAFKEGNCKSHDQPKHP